MRSKGIFIFIILNFTLLFGKSDSLATFYETNLDIEKRYNQFVEKSLREIGFSVTNPHHRVNDQYKRKYGSTKLDILSFLPIVNENVVMELFNIDPRVAGFSPFNMLIYKLKDENITHIGHLDPKAMLDILGVEDSKVREKFIDSFKSLDNLMQKEFKGAKVVKVPLKALPKPDERMFNFIYEFNRPEDLDEFIDEFQNRFENAFINRGYLIAGFYDFLADTDRGEEVLEDFDIFWSYSLCHLGYSYAMFDNENARADAGLFAPCTMYMFLKKGDNRLVIGMPRLENVRLSLDIKDKKRVEWIRKLDREIPQILRDLGMVEILNVNPLKELPKAVSSIPSTPKGKQNISIDSKLKVDSKDSKMGTNEINITLPTPPKPTHPVRVNVINRDEHIGDRTIKFSKRYPPSYVPLEERVLDKLGEDEVVGDVNNGRVAVNLVGEFLDVDEVIERLKRAGFEIVAVTPLNSSKDLVSIVFTNRALKEMASSPKRGFLATLRVVVDKKNRFISFINPLYVAKAFLQDEFDKKRAKEILDKILKEFPDLKNSADKYKFQALSNYQFMEGMPKYGDMIELAKGDNLLQRAKSNKSVAFIEELDNNSSLIGINLSRRTGKFVEKIGRKNGVLLPYPILIENSRAYILDPKYYISLMYPNLKMEEFMKIATTPGAIVKECKRVFK